MEQSVTIDAAGRLVVPKAVRDRLRLTAGTRLFVTTEDGRLVLSPERREPRLVERDGFLVLDLGLESPADVDPRRVRDDRLRDLVDYAMKK